MFSPDVCNKRDQTAQVEPMFISKQWSWIPKAAEHAVAEFKIRGISGGTTKSLQKRPHSLGKFHFDPMSSANKKNKKYKKLSVGKMEFYLKYGF